LPSAMAMILCNEKSIISLRLYGNKMRGCDKLISGG
jgi:hypothetical protein